MGCIPACVLRDEALARKKEGQSSLHTYAGEARIELRTQRSILPPLQDQSHLPRQQLFQKLPAQVISYAVMLQIRHLGNADSQGHTCLALLHAVDTLNSGRAAGVCCQAVQSVCGQGNDLALLQGRHCSRGVVRHGRNWVAHPCEVVDRRAGRG